MKKLIAYLLLTTSSAWAGLPPTTAKPQSGSSSVMFQTQAPFNQITKTSGTAGLVETGNTNIIGNPGFEATTGTSLWTASGGTFTTTTTTANVGSGLKAGSWDSNAASQTLTSTAVAIPAGDYGANYEVSANLECASGTCTHTLQAFDGTNVIASQTITSSLTYARTTLNFVAPTSGNISARIVSVASDEPTIYVDDVYVGRARNVGSVAQAELVGTVLYTPATNCAWSSNTNGTFGNFGVDSDCTTPSGSAITGRLSAPATKIPGVTLNNPGTGVYVVIAKGFFLSTASSGRPCAWALSDGTNRSTSGTIPNPSTESNGTNQLRGVFTYNTPIGSSVTWQIQATGDVGAQTCEVNNNTAVTRELVFEVYRYPLSSEIAYRPEQINKFGSVLFSDGTSRFSSNITSNTYTTASITSLQTYASYVGSAQACTNSNDLCVRIPQLPTGSWKVTLTGGYIGDSTSSSACRIAIFDGTNRESWFSSLTGSVDNRATYSNGTAYFTYSSQADREFTIQLSRVNGTGNCIAGFHNGASGTNNNPPLRITVEPANPSLLAPNLVGSVTSLSTGSERIERIQFGGSTVDNYTSLCTSNPCTIWRQSGNWVSSVGRTSAGLYTINFTSGVFAQPPTCTISSRNGATTTGISSIPNNITTSLMDLQVRNGADSTNVDAVVQVVCMGPRGSL